MIALALLLAAGAAAPPGVALLGLDPKALEASGWK